MSTQYPAAFLVQGRHSVHRRWLIDTAVFLEIQANPPPIHKPLSGWARPALLEIARTLPIGSFVACSGHTLPVSGPQLPAVWVVQSSLSSSTVFEALKQPFQLSSAWDWLLVLGYCKRSLSKRIHIVSPRFLPVPSLPESLTQWCYWVSSVLHNILRGLSSLLLPSLHQQYHLQAPRRQETTCPFPEFPSCLLCELCVGLDTGHLGSGFCQHHLSSSLPGTLLTCWQHVPAFNLTSQIACRSVSPHSLCP